jgi:hypothetical protein
VSAFSSLAKGDIPFRSLFYLVISRISDELMNFCGKDQATSSWQAGSANGRPEDIRMSSRFRIDRLVIFPRIRLRRDERDGMERRNRMNDRKENSRQCSTYGWIQMHSLFSKRLKWTKSMWITTDQNFVKIRRAG